MTGKMGRAAAAVLLAGLLLPITAEAQRRSSFAADLTSGKAIGNGGPYDQRNMTNFRLGVSGRTGRDSAVAVFFEGSANATMHSTCKPTGPCEGDYPELLGVGILIGGLVAPRRNVEYRFGLGGTMYTVTNVADVQDCPNSFSSCGVTDKATLAVVAQSDVALFPTKHVGIVVGMQYIILPGYRVDDDPQTLWMAPFVFGIRVR